MTDPASVSAAFTSVKTALEITKLIRESGSSLEKAEVKLKLADLVSTLADVNTELAGVQEIIEARDARIAELERAFERRGDVQRVHDAVYLRNAKGAAEGDPYCLRCWEVDHVLRPVIHKADNYRIRVCAECRTEYEGRLAGKVLPSE